MYIISMLIPKYLNFYMSRPSNIFFDENSIIFEDGVEEKIDAIVLCTGFINGLDFLSAGIKDTIQYEEMDQRQPGIMFYHILHPDLPGFYLIGQYKGIVLPSCDIQAKTIIRLITGEAKLPPREIMLQDMRNHL